MVPAAALLVVHRLNAISNLLSENKHLLINKENEDDEDARGDKYEEICDLLDGCVAGLAVAKQKAPDFEKAIEYINAAKFRFVHFPAHGSSNFGRYYYIKLRLKLALRIVRKHLPTEIK